MQFLQKKEPKTIEIKRSNTANLNAKANDTELKDDMRKKKLLQKYWTASKGLMITSIVVMAIQIVFGIFCLIWFDD